MVNIIARRHGVAVFLSLFAGFFAFVVFLYRNAVFDPNEASLDFQTRSQYAVFDGERVSFREEFGEAAEAVGRFRGRGKRVALWLGTSQIHAINMYREGDRLAVSYADERAKERGADIVHLQVSLPNADMNEYLAVYAALRARGRAPDWVVLSLVYDDLREDHVRKYVVENLPPLDGLKKEGFGAGIDNLARAAAERAAGGGENADAEKTLQAVLEGKVTAFIEKAWPEYALRDRSRGRITLVMTRASYWLYSLTNRIRGRGRDSVRTAPRVSPVPKDAKAWNMAAFESLMAMAKKDGVKVLLYRAPHPKYDGPFYHDRADYDRFAARGRGFAEPGRVYYRDLENLIPAKFWYRREAMDFFHFQEPGHRLLGNEIDRIIEEIKKEPNAF